jgi:hypothetical protein
MARWQGVTCQYTMPKPCSMQQNAAVQFVHWGQLESWYSDLTTKCKKVDWVPYNQNEIVHFHSWNLDKFRCAATICYNGTIVGVNKIKDSGKPLLHAILPSWISCHFCLPSVCILFRVFHRCGCYVGRCRATRTVKPERKDWNGGAAGQGSVAGEVGVAGCYSTFAQPVLQISEQNVTSLLAFACRFSLAESSMYS